MKRSGIRIKLLLFICLLGITAVGIFGCSSNFAPEVKRAEQGVLDLTGWDLDTMGNIKLDGEWSFYWQRLLQYGDSELANPDQFVEVPNYWNTYTFNGDNLPATGYSTYRLHIKSQLPAGTPLGLNLYTFSSAYRVYVNNQLIASNGLVSDHPSEEVGEHRPQVVFFTAPAAEFDLIVQVSNARYARGGFWYSAWLGTQPNIIEQNNVNFIKESLVAGALVLIGAFYFIVYCFRREFKLVLYFSLLCLTIAVTLDMLGQFILTRYIPGIRLDTVMFIWYTSSMWLVFFLVLYLHRLFASRLSAIILRSLTVVCIGLQALNLFAPLEVYAQTINLRNLLAIASVLSAFAITANGIRQKYKYAVHCTVGMVILLATYVHDILYWNNWMHSWFGEWAYVGILFFLLTQMLVHAGLVSDFYNKKMATELSFLQAQIKPHFLFNTLNTFIAISHDDVEKARSLVHNFSDYLRKSFDFKSSNQFVTLDHEVVLVQSYVEIEKARFQDKIEVVFHLPDEMDYMVPILMLQPIVENAIIHGILPTRKQGVIEVEITKYDDELRFRVKDNGVGMDKHKMDAILSTNEEQRVGLANINNRLKKLFGKGLAINSAPGRGTEMSWRIPLQKRVKEREFV